MAKGTIKSRPSKKTSVLTPEKIINKLDFESGILVPSKDGTFKNGLGQAIGFNSQNWMNGGFGGGNPWAPQVEQINTLYENMRWYLISNFWQPLSQAYVEFGLVQTVVDVPVDDALRGGIEIQSKQLDEEEIQELLISLDRDNDLVTAGQAGKWNRLYGGAGIITIVGDQDPETPLNIEAIKRDTELEFRAVDMWELFWDQQNTDGYDPQLQSTDFEYYNYYAEKIHKSRVMRMKGITAPSFIRPRLRGWGFSVVEVLIRSINQYLKATDLSFACLDEFKVDVYKIKNFVNTLLSPTGNQEISQRIQMANWQKNYQNALVLDSEDDYIPKQLTFSGLAETMEGIRMQVAADLRMPITKLFGTSASKGLGPTDQNDMENYNSMVESQVRNKLKYEILKICQIKCQKLFGFIPDDLQIEFPPLRVLSAEQEETVKTSQFNRLLQLRQVGEISSKDLRLGINKAGLLPIQLDPEDMEINPPNVDDASGELSDKETSANKHDSRNPRVSNSSGFDRASYDADGGDSWTDKIADFRDPGKVDEDLWMKSKTAAMETFGKMNWAFVAWKYKKLGGKIK